MIYLGDGILGDTFYDKCKEKIFIIVQDLSQAGLTVNMLKSNLEPSKKCRWLGFIIDTETFRFLVPEEKIQKLKDCLANLIPKKFWSARELKVIGLIISMSPAVGSLTQILTRNLYYFVNEKPTWDYQHKTNKSVLAELQFWQDNINLYNGYSIIKNSNITKVVFSDASENSYGGIVVSKQGNIVARDGFTTQEKGKSSTFRELIPVEYTLKSFHRFLSRQKVLWHSDNMNVARIIKIGSSLQLIALEIFRHCLEYDIELATQWILRRFNTVSDSISRFVDYDEWGIDFETFNFIQEKFGKFSIDRFSSNTNRKLDHFKSKYFCPDQEEPLPQSTTVCQKGISTYMVAGNGLLVLRSRISEEAVFRLFEVKGKLSFFASPPSR